MCLGIPAKVMEIKGKKAVVYQGDHTHEVDVSLVSKKIKSGDYILVHHDLAINKIPKSEAKKIIALTSGLRNKQLD